MDRNNWPEWLVGDDMVVIDGLREMQAYCDADDFFRVLEIKKILDTQLIDDSRKKYIRGSLIGLLKCYLDDKPEEYLKALSALDRLIEMDV